MESQKKKLQLKKKTVIRLSETEKNGLQGGLTLSCFTCGQVCNTKRICPTPPISNTCPNTI